MILVVIGIVAGLAILLGFLAVHLAHERSDTMPTPTPAVIPPLIVRARRAAFWWKFSADRADLLDKQLRRQLDACASSLAFPPSPVLVGPDTIDGGQR